MAYQGIGTGTTPNDNSGDSLLTGAIKINSNFEEIYNALGDGSDISLTRDSIVSGIQTGITVAYDVDTDNVNYLVSTEYIQDAVGSAINAGIQTGMTVTYDDVNNRIDFNSGVGDAINAGIQTGMTVTYDDINNRINFNNDIAGPYPFTTRGFSIPV